MRYWMTCCLLLSSLTFADTASQMQAWFNQMDYANITEPGITRTQSSLHGTLGGISTRAPITQPFHFIDVQTPRFSAGCGGIDLYAGGFNMINADQFVDNLRAIGENATSLAFMLAIQVVSPQLASQMENFNTMAQKLNQMNINSCEAATALVGGTLEQFGATEANCTIKRMSQFNETWGEANHLCTTGGGREEAEDSPGGANQVTFTKGNLTWYVLMQEPFFANDLIFAELIMNLIGTVIVSDAGAGDDAPQQVRVLDPAINDEGHWTQRGNTIYSALLYGRSMNDLEYYRCQDRLSNADACLTLSPTLERVTPDWDGIYTRINTQVLDIVNKIYIDEPLTDTQRGILQSSLIPLYDYLVAVATYFKPSQFFNSNITNEFNKLIAEEIVLRNLAGVLEGARHSLTLVPNNLSQAKEIVELRARINDVLTGVGTLREEVKISAEDYHALQRRTQVYRKLVMSRVSPMFVESANWEQ